MDNKEEYVWAGNGSCRTEFGIKLYGEPFVPSANWLQRKNRLVALGNIIKAIDFVSEKPTPTPVDGDTDEDRKDDNDRDRPNKRKRSR